MTSEEPSKDVLHAVLNAHYTVQNPGLAVYSIAAEGDEPAAVMVGFQNKKSGFVVAVHLSPTSAANLAGFLDGAAKAFGAESEANDDA